MGKGNFLRENKRTHYCGDLRVSHEGEKVVLMGWVDTRRDHGGLIFVDLRDRNGLVQVVINPKDSGNSAARSLRNEFVVALIGEVRRRPEGMVNSNLSTGEIEVVVEKTEVLSEAETPPFQHSDDKVGENLRLKYRYLDIRSPRLSGFLKTRHRILQQARKILSDKGFTEVETPILYKSTPEGARDYLVPSRVHPGQFYALPQSPQTLKQLLMIGGMDRYFQICRCFRDEDLRADRQPEFSQIDVEMSFVEPEDIMELTESMVVAFWKEHKGIDLEPIPVMTWQQAMDDYGIDRPDLRNPLKLVDITESIGETGFKVIDDVVARKGAVKALPLVGGGSFSRGQMDKLTALAKQMGAKGLIWIKSTEEGELSSPISKFFSSEKLKEIFDLCEGKKGGAVFIVADSFEVSCGALAQLRNQLGREMNLIDTSKDRFCWVVDFPMLEFSPEEGRWVARHHPFTAPKEEYEQLLFENKEQEFGQITAKAYDLVCNGYELAGGSVRIHKQNLQKAVFKGLGLSEEECQEKFGFFIEALSYGTPPHGGIAWGLDRLVMILCGTDAIRDVIAFPKTAKASDLMAEAPGPVAQDQLLELGLRLGLTATEAAKKK